MCACGDLTNEYPGREYAVPKGDEQVKDFKEIASELHKDIAMVCSHDGFVETIREVKKV